MARAYKVVLSGSYQQQQWVNSLNYVADTDVSGNDGALALANALGFADTNGDIDITFPADSVAGKYVNYASTSVFFNTLYIYALYNVDDLFDGVFPAGTAGVYVPGGPLMPPFVTASIRSNRVKRSVRRSFKRPPGADEDTFTNQAVTGTALARLEELATALSDTPSGTFGSTSATFIPATFSLTRDEQPDGSVRYVLPGTESELINQSAVGISFEAETKVTSQVSRKRGKGS